MNAWDTHSWEATDEDWCYKCKTCGICADFRFNNMFYTFGNKVIVYTEDMCEECHFGLITCNEFLIQSIIK